MRPGFRPLLFAALAAGAAGGACDEDSGGEAQFDIADVPARLAPSPMRRLTHVEYRHTVRDLFPGVEAPDPGFAADAPVNGFDNHAASQQPSALLIEQYRTAAAQVADLAAPSAAPDCDDADDACIRAWVRELGGRAFRRPLSWREALQFGGFATQWAAQAGVGVRGATRLVIRAMLQSPQFLYRIELGADRAAPDLGDRVPLSSWELASRLSYLLWASMPDQALFDRAAAGELATADQVAAEAERLLDDPRAEAALLEFHRQWLELDRVSRTNKDPDAFPEFNGDVRAAMRREPDLFISAVLGQGARGTMAALLTESFTFVDRKLAAIYGVTSPEEGWARVELDPRQRSGVLTQPHFLAAQAHVIHPSPVLRGVFVLDRLLCSRPPPPDEAINLAGADEGATTGPVTNRERYAAHTEQPACRGCHTAIDGIGFAFEHYDAVGAWRDEDAQRPVDASGELVVGQERTEVDGGVQLSHRIAQSGQFARCATLQWYRWTFGRSDHALDATTVEALTAGVLASGGVVRDLLLALVRTETFRKRPVQR